MAIKVNGIKKITNLSAASTINDADVFMIETTSGSRKVTGATLKTLINNLAQTKADAVGDAAAALIADEFDASNSYEAGDYVMSEGKLYKFTSAHETGAFDGTDAVEVTVADEMVSDVIISGIKSMIAPEYDSSLTYNENDYVIYNNQLYKANQAIETAEAWNSAHWTVTSTTTEIQELQRNISYPTAIVVTQEPTQTQYEIGVSLDRTGMVVTLIWSTGETRALSSDEYTVAPSIFSVVGNQNVTIIYTGVEPYVLTTTQPVSVVNIIPDTWEKMVRVSQAGVAQDFFSVGDIINDTYTIGTTEYTNPWIVADFQTVELEDGTIYNDVPILVMQHTNHENVMFDAPEQTEATEETASAGHYYYGYTAEGTVYTALNLSVGDTIPYEEYDKVFVTLWNSVNAIRYGTNSWKYSYARQYLNNSGTGWWQPTHECDVMPSGYESRVGFQSYISNDLVSAIHPIKITTKESNYMGGGVDTIYDKFWLPSLSEMNISNGNIATVDGEPWQYYKELLESEEKVSSGTYAVLKRYAVNATTSAQHHWVRSANLGNSYEWIVNSSGQTYGNRPYGEYRLAPACAII